MYSDSWREQNPISITHGFGRKPIVQVLDLSDYAEDSYGHYQSLDEYSNVVHTDDNNLEVWSECSTVLIILIG